jgi:hypothetical protein
MPPCVSTARSDAVRALTRRLAQDRPDCLACFCLLAASHRPTAPMSVDTCRRRSADRSSPSGNAAALDKTGGVTTSFASWSIAVRSWSRAASGWTRLAAPTAAMSACRAGPRRYSSSRSRLRRSRRLSFSTLEKRRRARAWWRRRSRRCGCRSRTGIGAARTIAGAEAVPPRGRIASWRAKPSSRRRASSLIASLTSCARAASRGSVHPGVSVNLRAASSETCSIRHAPSIGPRCQPRGAAGAARGSSSSRPLIDLSRGYAGSTSRSGQAGRGRLRRAANCADRGRAPPPITPAPKSATTAACLKGSATRTTCC